MDKKNARLYTTKAKDKTSFDSEKRFQTNAMWYIYDA